MSPAATLWVTPAWTGIALMFRVGNESAVAPGTGISSQEMPNTHRAATEGHTPSPCVSFSPSLQLSSSASVPGRVESGDTVIRGLW